MWKLHFYQQTNTLIRLRIINGVGRTMCLTQIMFQCWGWALIMVNRCMMGAICPLSGIIAILTISLWLGESVGV